MKVFCLLKVALLWAAPSLGAVLQRRRPVEDHLERLGASYRKRAALRAKGPTGKLAVLACAGISGSAQESGRRGIFTEYDQFGLQ